MEKKYLDLDGLSHYTEKLDDTFLNKTKSIVKNEIDNFFDGDYEVGEGGEIIIKPKDGITYKLEMNEDRLELIGSDGSISSVELFFTLA